MNEMKFNTCIIVNGRLLPTSGDFVGRRRNCLGTVFVSLRSHRNRMHYLRRTCPNLEKD